MIWYMYPMVCYDIKTKSLLHPEKFIFFQVKQKHKNNDFNLYEIKIFFLNKSLQFILNHTVCYVMTNENLVVCYGIVCYGISFKCYSMRFICYICTLRKIQITHEQMHICLFVNFQLNNKLSDTKYL